MTDPVKSSTPWVNKVASRLRGESMTDFARRLEELARMQYEALRIIADEQQCVDNLMGNKDIAQAALAAFEQMEKEMSRGK